MVPSTKHLKGVRADVMMLFCHGNRRKVIPANPASGARETRFPGYLSFHETYGVSIRGEHDEVAPHAVRLWTCSSYSDGRDVYTKPDFGVALSEVVDGSRLVILLCCHSRSILTEYGNEGRNGVKPDFIAFSGKDLTYDTSVNVFLALLITAIERSVSNVVSGPWHELVQRNVCQVFLWVKRFGDHGSDGFWNFLQAFDCISIVKGGSFRIKGCIHAYTKQEYHPLRILQDLRSIQLWKWCKGNDAAQGCFEFISHVTEEAKLIEFKTAPLPRGSGCAVGGARDVHGLLLQLQGLLRDA
jgi:hypothetical protein